MHTLFLVAGTWLFIAVLAAAVWSLTARHHKKGGGRRG